MTNKLMRCGHAANAVREDGSPVCVICVGIVEGADQIVPEEKQPDLTNRYAMCVYCTATVSSNLDLPFFEFKPTDYYDRYYCGCRGWD